MHHELKTLTREEAKEMWFGHADSRAAVLALLDERDAQAEALKQAAADNERLTREVNQLRTDMQHLSTEDERGHAIIDASDGEDPDSSSADTLAYRVGRLVADRERLTRELTEAKADRVVLEARWEKASAEAERAKAEVHLLMHVAQRVATASEPRLLKYATAAREALAHVKVENVDTWLAAHDEQTRRAALTEAINAQCPSCREGVPFRKYGNPNHLPHEHFQQTTTDDDGTPRGLVNKCHAVTLRCLAASPKTGGER
jgi:hypothetical protein